MCIRDRQWSTRDLLYRLPSNAVLRQAAQGKAPIPEAGALHAIYVNEIARYEDRQKQKEQKKQQESKLASGQTMASSDREDGLNSQSAPRPVRNAQTDSNESNIAPSPSTTPDPQPFNEADTARIVALAPPQRVATLATMPVSYTHLDVYKRQAGANPLQVCRRKRRMLQRIRHQLQAAPHMLRQK